MKRLALIKAAIDFAFANYQANAIELAQKSIAAFVSENGQPADLTIWTNTVSQQVVQCTLMARQKLPSEIAEAQVEAQADPKPAVSNAAAVSAEPKA
jgi:hypothetical protein